MPLGIWFLKDFGGFWRQNGAKLAPRWPPKSMPRKTSFFLRKNKVSAKNRFSKLASIFHAIWMATCLHFASKIHQNPLYMQAQEGLKKWSILASNFTCFRLHFESQVGGMLATFFVSRSPKRPPRSLKIRLWGPSCSQDRPRSLQDGPRSFQDPSRSSKTPSFWIHFW